MRRILKVEDWLKIRTSSLEEMRKKVAEQWEKSGLLDGLKSHYKIWENLEKDANYFNEDYFKNK